MQLLLTHGVTCLPKYTHVSVHQGQGRTGLSVVALTENSRLFPPSMLTILQDHVCALARRAQFLWALDIAQSSGEVLVHHAANVPLEIGEEDTPGIPLSLYRSLQLDTSLLHLFHGEQHR